MGAMFQHWIMREPTLAFGLPVYAFAAILFPLHLGWIGTSWRDFAGYLVIAAILFSLVDALTQPASYPKWSSVIPQSLLSLMALAMPAVLAFALGSVVGPVDAERAGVQALHVRSVGIAEQLGETLVAARDAAPVQQRNAQACMVERDPAQLVEHSVGGLQRRLRSQGRATGRRLLGRQGGHRGGADSPMLSAAGTRH